MSKPDTRIVVRLSDLTAEPVDWLWPGYLAAGKPTLLDGDPDEGKSLITLDVVARLTAGRAMPDGYQPPRPETVLLLAGGEDAARDAIMPRLQAAGADMTRVYRFEGHARGGGLTRPPVFPEDAVDVRDLLRELEARLLVADPLLSLFGDRAGCVNGAAVRSVLTPLTQVCEGARAGALTVRHLNKGNSRQRALYRGSGNIAIIGNARMAFIVGRDQLDPDLRLLACTKNNEAPKPPTLAYRIRTDARAWPIIEWCGPVAVTADDVVMVDGERFATTLPRAVAFLQETLADGPHPRGEIIREARAMDISTRTLERAKAELRLASHAVYENGHNVWYWRIPLAPTPEEECALLIQELNRPPDGQAADVPA
jgi:hypothetical protein